MEVRVRLFAGLRDVVGAAEVRLALWAGATAEDAWTHLAEAHPDLAPRRGALAAAVNRRYVRFDATLGDGDELAFIPPVSGG